MAIRRFERTDREGFKFWEVEVRRSSPWVLWQRWGPISNSQPAAQRREYCESSEAAEVKMRMYIRDRLSSGYVEVYVPGSVRLQNEEQKFLDRLRAKVAKLREG